MLSLGQGLSPGSGLRVLGSEACLAKLLAAGLLIACLLALPACRSGVRANYEAVVSLHPDPGASMPSEETVAAELRARIEASPIKAEVDPGAPGDGQLVIRIRAAGKQDALDHLDNLCLSGTLSVRAVHDQSVYLSSAARDDPSKLPPGHEILTFSQQVGELSRREDLVVETADILNGSHVERATPEDTKEGAVQITLSASGGQRLREATEKMQKGRSRLAIIYDGLIISAPVVGTVLSSEFSLEGFNSFAEARAVAAALNKPLSTKLLIESLKPLD